MGTTVECARRDPCHLWRSTGRFFYLGRRAGGFYVFRALQPARGDISVGEWRIMEYILY